MKTNNQLLTAAGYAPAAEVAQVLGKALSTVHRMVQRNGILHQRDGQFLYISVVALMQHYNGCEPIQAALYPLMKKYVPIPAKQPAASKRS